MSATHDKIRVLTSQILKLQTIEKHYINAVQDLKKTQTQFDKLEQQLHDEYADIESLEKLTLKGVFHSILGDKEKQLDSARQEYLQVTLKYNECKKSIETLQYEIKILKQKTILLKELEEDLKRLQKIREEELKLEDSPEGNKLRTLLKLTDQNIAFGSLLVDIRNTGQEATKKLSMAVLALQEAKNWGDWDMMQKKGRMADYNKRSAIDDAKEFAFEAQRVLISYQRQLDEVGIHLKNNHLEIGSLNTFLDIFFDNLITDWIFQQRIKKTLSNLNIVVDDVKYTLSELEELKTKNASELSDLLKRKEKLLIETA